MAAESAARVNAEEMDAEAGEENGEGRDEGRGEGGKFQTKVGGQGRGENCSRDDDNDGQLATRREAKLETRCQTRLLMN